MVEYVTPKHGQLPNPYAKAREILDGMSRYRIDPRRIVTIDGGPNAKGGQGTVVVGTMIVPLEIRERLYTWTPEPLPEELLDQIYAIRESKRDREEPKTGVKSSKSLAERLLAGSIADLPDRENFPTWLRDKYAEELLDTKYAIKKLEWAHEDAEESVKFFKSFVNELSLMAELSHPNIIKLTGFVEDIEEYDAWIVLPWEPNGNVREFLQSGEWDIPERISLIQDVVKGVEHLHTREPPICHGDLKSLNILVNSSNHAVITDFGSARRKTNADAKDHMTSEEAPQAANDDTAQDGKTPKIEFNRSTLELTLTGPLFTLRWAAPEVLADETKGLPSDMWAVGWICWEIITGKIPFEELYQEAKVIACVVSGKLPAIRKEAQLSLVLELCALMSDCWTRDPAGRIGASDFERRLSMMPSIAPSDGATGGSKIRSAELLLELGEMYRMQQNNAMAKDHLDYALIVASQRNNHNARAGALRSLGQVYQAESRYQEAEKALTEAHEIHARIGNDLGVANALGGLGEIYRVQLRHHEAEKALTEAHEIHARIGNDLGVASALGGLGQIYRAQSRYQEAEKALTEAHEIHTRIGGDQGAANELVGLGQIYGAQSKNPEAEAAYRQAHATYSRVGDILGTGNSLYGLGLLFSRSHRYEEAQSFFLDALAAYSRAGSSFSQARTLLALALVYQTRGNYLQAEESVIEALTIGVQLKDDFVEAGVSTFLAFMFGNHSKYSTTLAAPLQAGRVCEPLVHDIRRAAALHDLGRTLLTQSKYAEAAESYLQARDIFSRMGNRHGEASMFRSLGTLFTVQGRFELAMKRFSQARRISAGISDLNGEVRALGCLMGACLQQPTLAGLRSYCVDALKIYGRIQWSTNKAPSASSIGQGDLNLHQDPARVSKSPVPSTPSRGIKQKTASTDELDEETSAGTSAAKKAKLAPIEPTTPK